MRNKIAFILFVLPTILMAQEQQSKKRNSFFAGTSQGISFLKKEALSNTDKNTFDTTPGYAYSYNFGVSIDSKSKKSFSEISLGYRSFSNGFKGTIDLNTSTGISAKTSRDRFNFLTLEYRYSRYIKTINEYNTFFSIGIQTNYIINRKVKLNLEDSKTKIVTKGKNISSNYVLNTSPTLMFSYGLELDKLPFSIKKCICKSLRQRLSLDVSYDLYALNIISSPANSYVGVAINYRVLF
jgi:hypothetical protein